MENFNYSIVNTNRDIYAFQDACYIIICYVNYSPKASSTHFEKLKLNYKYFLESSKKAEYNRHQNNDLETRYYLYGSLTGHERYFLSEIINNSLKFENLENKINQLEIKIEKTI